MIALCNLCASKWVVSCNYCVILVFVQFMLGVSRVSMENPQNIHPSVAVNARLLKNDRKAAGYTQASFAAACDSV